MDLPVPIDSEEILLRRLRPHDSLPASVQVLPDGGFRATSFSMDLRPLPDGTREEGLSCTRLRITSPRELLDQLLEQGINPENWLVCYFRVADVENLGLVVVAKPTVEDPGHCEIIAQSTQPYSKGVRQKLAKHTRVISDQQVSELKAGDNIE